MGSQKTSRSCDVSIHESPHQPGQRPLRTLYIVHRPEWGAVLLKQSFPRTLLSVDQLCQNSGDLPILLGDEILQSQNLVQLLLGSRAGGLTCIQPTCNTSQYSFDTFVVLYQAQRRLPSRILFIERTDLSLKLSRACRQ